MQRRFLLRTLAGFTCAVLAPVVIAQPRPQVEVWKDPNCGCCKDWVDHLQASGFQVKVHDIGNAAARKRLGIPDKLGSCHTASISGYVIEGHVPASDIHRLLKEKPRAVGLALPGMPVGSPGMDAPIYGGRKDPYDVLLVLKDGSTRIYQSYPSKTSTTSTQS
ncbi:MAG: DUF411 domain-containing protein [Polaromonas sp.]|uniref:DUF411 domain-containing protein n=1 Tax=Polaromonas sp. TaxID=1869339 RepID=UPI002736F334|nr:DUF411 domain-containing protein [Polaromonas sp.]MDP2818898.1 DUF411 domain-containing protein [Polaromonas sp.]